MALNKSIKQIAELEENIYKDYLKQVNKLQNQLNNTPKIFKNKRKEIEQQIKETQKRADEHYKSFIDVCNDLV